MNVKLNQKQRLAVRSLVAGEPPAEIARRLKLRPGTLSAWHRLPAFAAYRNVLLEDMACGMSYQKLQLITKSIAELGRHLTDPSDGDRRPRTALSLLKTLAPAPSHTRSASDGSRNAPKRLRNAPAHLPDDPSEQEELAELFKALSELCQE